jgi:YD repeat-containing protein
MGIPLYNLKAGKISFPISLNYYSENEDDVVAGWVGENWNLSTECYVERIVKGYPDDFYQVNIERTGPGQENSTVNGYFFNYPNDFSYGEPNPDNIVLVKNRFDAEQMLNVNLEAKNLDLIKGMDRYDSQPDEYNYRCGDLSGSFMIKKNGEVVVTRGPGVRIRVLPEGKTTQLALEYFELTTPSGIKYAFGLNDESVQYTETEDITKRYIRKYNYTGSKGVGIKSSMKVYKYWYNPWQTEVWCAVKTQQDEVGQIIDAPLVSFFPCYDFDDYEEEEERITVSMPRHKTKWFLNRIEDSDGNIIDLNYRPTKQNVKYYRNNNISYSAIGVSDYLLERKMVAATTAPALSVDFSNQYCKQEIPVLENVSSSSIQVILNSQEGREDLNGGVQLSDIIVEWMDASNPKPIKKYHFDYDMVSASCEAGLDYNLFGGRNIGNPFRNSETSFQEFHRCFLRKVTEIGTANNRLPGFTFSYKNGRIDKRNPYLSVSRCLKDGNLTDNYWFNLYAGASEWKTRNIYSYFSKLNDDNWNKVTYLDLNFKLVESTNVLDTDFDNGFLECIQFPTGVQKAIKWKDRCVEELRTIVEENTTPENIVSYNYKMVQSKGVRSGKFYLGKNVNESYHQGYVEAKFTYFRVFNDTNTPTPELDGFGYFQSIKPLYRRLIGGGLRGSKQTTVSTQNGKEVYFFHLCEDGIPKEYSCNRNPISAESTYVDPANPFKVDEDREYRFPLYGLRINNGWKSGKLSKKLVLDGNNDTLLMETFTYKKIGDERLIASVIGSTHKSIVLNKFEKKKEKEVGKFEITYFGNQDYVLDSHEKREFFYKEGVKTTTKMTTQYCYNEDPTSPGFKLPTKTEYDYGQNHKIVKEFKYVGDFSDLETKEASLDEFTYAVHQMNMEGRYGVPLENLVWKESNGVRKLLSASLTKYKDFGGDKIRPYQVWSVPNGGTITSFTPLGLIENQLFSDTLYQLKGTIDRYDVYGNVEEAHRENGKHSCTLWGYEGQFPVLSVENATCPSVTNVLGATADLLRNSTDPVYYAEQVQSLRDHDSMKESMVTLTAYEFSGGMKQQIDPNGYSTFYDYDEFGRLVRTLDTDRKIKEEYLYHYAINPIVLGESCGQTVCLGSTLTFTAESNGNIVAYQWCRNGVKISGATNSDYKITNITENDEGQYTCRVTDITGWEEESDACQLTVDTRSFVQGATTIEAPKGSRVSFSCLVEPNEGLEYQWQWEDPIITGTDKFQDITPYFASGAQGINSELFSFVIPEDWPYSTTVFRCKVTSENGCEFLSETTTLNLTTSSGNPLICENYAFEGSGFCFNILVEGQPYQKGIALPVGAEITIQSNEKNYDSITLDGVAVRLTATGGDSDRFTLPNSSGNSIGYDLKLKKNGQYVGGVILSGIRITSSPSSQVVCAGSTAIFSVGAKGETLGYQWYHNNISISGANSSSLQIQSVTSGDVGEYYCVVSSSVDQLSSSKAQLSLKSPLSITSSPASRTLCLSEATTLTVGATGEIAKYQWYKNGVAISSAAQASYRITNATESAEAAYTCKVTDVCNNIKTSASCQVTVENPLIFSGGPTTIEVAKGKKASFSCSLLEGSVLQYQWQWEDPSAYGMDKYRDISSSFVSGTSGNHNCLFSFTIPTSWQYTTLKFRCKITTSNGCVNYSPITTLNITSGSTGGDPCEGYDHEGSGFCFNVYVNGLKYSREMPITTQDKVSVRCDALKFNKVMVNGSTVSISRNSYNGYDFNLPASGPTGFDIQLYMNSSRVGAFILNNLN